MAVNERKLPTSWIRKGSVDQYSQLFITNILFSSPRLRFSRPQKQAILKWARELGAPRVPTLNALDTCQKQIETRVGHPSEKVIAPSGNVFYINDIGKAISKVRRHRHSHSVSNSRTSKDYSNPITRFSMRDYPQDDGARMSQVHNGSKMLLDVPADVVPTAIRVNGRLFFNGELLQRKSGAYFLPDRFFTRPSPAYHKQPQQPHEELFSLGWDVVRSQVHVSKLIVSAAVHSTTITDGVHCEQAMCHCPDFVIRAEY